jgi:hypothetical protein
MLEDKVIWKLIKCQNFLEEGLDLLMMAEFWHSATEVQKRYLFELIESAKMSINLAFEKLKKENKKGFWYWISVAKGRIEEGREFAGSIIYKIDPKFWELLGSAVKNLIEVRETLKSDTIPK